MHLKWSLTDSSELSIVDSHCKCALFALVIEGLTLFSLVIEGMTLFSLVIESMVSESDGETYLGEFCSKCKKCSNAATFARAHATDRRASGAKGR